MTEDKEGKYCTICGGLPPSGVPQITVDGKEIGISEMDTIMVAVRKQNLTDGLAIRQELLKETKRYNYVPGKKAEAYADSLLAEYRRRYPV
jgi:hypothetical protein